MTHVQLTWRVDVTFDTLADDVENSCGPHYNDMETRLWLLLKATLYGVALPAYTVAIEG